MLQRNIGISSLLLFISILFLFSTTSCNWDTSAPVDIVLPDTVSFSNDIIPIFEASCNSSGCHNKGGFAPILEADVAYGNLISTSMIDLTVPEASVLYERMITNINPMPPAGLLPDSKTKLILEWIKQGALDN